MALKRKTRSIARGDDLFSLSREGLPSVKTVIITSSQGLR
jgi:hypothetical protein